MEKVTIYTFDQCPYCVRAKDLLKKRGIEYQEIRVDRDDEQRRNSLFQLSQMKTMPQIFIKERLIGGYSDLVALDELDELSSLSI